MEDIGISHCTPSDVRELAELYMVAFSAPTHQAMYRGLAQEDVIQRMEKSFAKTIAAQSDTSSRETHFSKITEAKTNEIIAMIIWIYLPNGYKPEEDPQVQVSDLPSGGNVQLMRDYAIEIRKLRSGHPGRHEGHWLLSLLCTHPNHERKGAASRLVRWVFERADSEGRRCYVDSSGLGYKMYQRCGFKDVGEMTLDLEKYEPGGGLEVQRWKAMVREPNTQTQ